MKNVILMCNVIYIYIEKIFFLWMKKQNMSQMFNHKNLSIFYSSEIIIISCMPTSLTNKNEFFFFFFGKRKRTFKKMICLFIYSLILKKYIYIYIFFYEHILLNANKIFELCMKKEGEY